MWATIFSTYITKKSLETKYPPVVITLVAILGFFSSKIIWLPLSIQSGMTASVFVGLGVMLKYVGFWDKPVMWQIQYIIPAFIIWLGEIIHTDSWMDIAQNRYPNGGFDFVGGLVQLYV